jgi:hypothetical protein
MQKAHLPGYLRPVQVKDNIRIGSANDGGYILPSSLFNEANRLVSFGISIDWKFEAGFLKSHPNSIVDCYDKTTTFRRALWWGITRFLGSWITRRKPHYIAWRKPFEYRFFTKSNVNLIQRFVGNKKGDDYIAPSEIFKDLPDDRCAILKVDVEGGEYNIINDIVEHEMAFSILAFEFHGTNHAKFEQGIVKLLEKFVITHVHANSCGGMDENELPGLLEITFASRATHGESPKVVGSTYRDPEDTENVLGVEDYLICFRESDAVMKKQRSLG